MTTTATKRAAANRRPEMSGFGSRISTGSPSVGSGGPTEAIYYEANCFIPTIS